MFKEKFDHNYDFKSKFEDSPFDKIPIQPKELKVEYNGLENYFDGIPIVKNERSLNLNIYRNTLFKETLKVISFQLNQKLMTMINKDS